MQHEGSYSTNLKMHGHYSLVVHLLDLDLALENSRCENLKISTDQFSPEAVTILKSERRKLVSASTATRMRSSAVHKTRGVFSWRCTEVKPIS